MDDFEPGKQYKFGGKWYVFQGGDPTNRDSWTEPKGSSYLGDAARSFIHGLSFNSSHQLAGLAAHPRRSTFAPPQAEPERAADRWPHQREVADRSMANIERIRDEHPVTAFAAEGLGGMAAPAMGTLKTARHILGATGSRLLAGMGGGAVGGGIGGAIPGAMENGVGGFALGGGVGAALGAVTGGLGGLAGRHLGTGSSADLAGAKLRSAFRMAGIPDPTAAASQLGPLGVPADLSPHLGDVARAAANEAPSLRAKGGPVEFIRRRHGQRGERIADDLVERVPGADVPYDQSVRNAQSNTRSVADAVYGPLEESVGVIEDPALLSLLSMPGIRQVVSGVAPPVADGTRGPTFRELQTIRRQLRDSQTSSHVSGNYNAADDAKAALELLDENLKTSVPGFREANAQYRIAKQQEDALELGRKNAFQSPANQRMALDPLPEEAHANFRRGMVEPMENQLRSRRGGGGLATQLGEAGDDAGTATTARLRNLVPEEGALGSLMQRLGQEHSQAGTHTALRGNSTTAQQLADANMPLSRAGMVKQLADWFVGSEQQRKQAQEYVGRVLLTRGPQAAAELESAIRTHLPAHTLLGGVVGSAGSRFVLQQ
jgi:hypothetical protein